MEFKRKYPSPNERTSGINTCEFIVLHHTGTKEGTIQGVLDGLYRRNDYASCHYAVDINGDVYKIGEDTDILWHSGLSSWKGRQDMNDYSIGIEVIGPLSDGGFTQQQKTSVGYLIRYLQELHDIPYGNILRHKDIAPKRKVDIADSFWNGHFISFEEYTKCFMENRSKYSDLHDALLEEFRDIAPIWDNFESDRIPKEIANITFFTILKRMKEGLMPGFAKNDANEKDPIVNDSIPLM